MLVQVVGAAGMLVNTMGWVDGLGFELLLHSITAMKANIVLVVGEDRLLTQLQTKYQVCQQHLKYVLIRCILLYPSLCLWRWNNMENFLCVYMPLSKYPEIASSSGVGSCCWSQHALCDDMNNV